MRRSFSWTPAAGDASLGGALLLWTRPAVSPRHELLLARSLPQRPEARATHAHTGPGEEGAPALCARAPRKSRPEAEGEGGTLSRTGRGPPPGDEKEAAEERPCRMGIGGALRQHAAQEKVATLTALTFSIRGSFSGGLGNQKYAATIRVGIKN